MNLQPTHKRRAFTLIELLVVIAIIGVLAGFLLPALSRAQWNARKTKCMNALKQFDVAIVTYQRDYDGEYPPWLSNLYPNYVPNLQLYICPEDGSKGKEGGKPSWQEPVDQQFVETDDFEGSDAGTVDPDAAMVMNPDVKANSYMYEFNCAECSWWNAGYIWEGKTCTFEDNYRTDPKIHPSGRAVLTWKEAKLWEVKYVGPHTPILRCFWHTLGSITGSADTVLNIASVNHNYYTSGSGGDDWKNEGR